MSDRTTEFETKRQAVVAYLRQHELDGVVLSRRPNFAWLTAGGSNHVSFGSDVGVASLLVTPDATYCVTSTIEAPRIADEELAGLPVELRPFAWHDADDTRRVWTELLDGRRIACDAPAGLPAGVASLASDFDQLRWSLCPGEIERYRALAREIAEVLENACRTARPGMTEFELGGAIAGPLLQRGIRAPVVLVAADERIARYRHPIPTLKKFVRYGMGVCSGERHGLYVSVTRLFSFGPIDDELRRRHEAVCTVDAEIMAATRPGATLGDVFRVAQDAYARTGFADEWQAHHQGGPTGYVGREARATPGSPLTVRANQAFAWNPSIAGTKSEDTILVTESGTEILSATGNWPTRPYTAGGKAWNRNDILQLTP